MWLREAISGCDEKIELDFVHCLTAVFTMSQRVRLCLITKHAPLGVACRSLSSKSNHIKYRFTYVPGLSESHSEENIVMTSHTRSKHSTHGVCKTLKMKGTVMIAVKI